MRYKDGPEDRRRSKVKKTIWNAAIVLISFPFGQQNPISVVRCARFEWELNFPVVCVWVCIGLEILYAASQLNVRLIFRLWLLHRFLIQLSLMNAPISLMDIISHLWDKSLQNCQTTTATTTITLVTSHSFISGCAVWILCPFQWLMHNSKLHFTLLTDCDCPRWIWLISSLRFYAYRSLKGNGW